MKARQYQLEAADAVWDSLKAKHKPVVQLPTGTGKSIVIAELLSRIQQHQSTAWVLTHVKELVQQNVNTYHNYYEQARCGIMCAGLDKYDYDCTIKFGTVQTMYGAVMAGKLDPPHVIMVDEAHRVPPGEEGKFYTDIFNRIPEVPLVGFTATPWRMDNGLIYKGKGAWFNHLCYTRPYSWFVEQKYLVPLVPFVPREQVNTDNIEIVAGEFVRSQVDDNISTEQMWNIVKDSIRLSEGRKFLAYYCAGVDVAKRVNAHLNKMGVSSDIVVGDTENRHDIINRWKSGKLRALVSVDVLTTGFDFPELDCLVVLRPTNSSSLWAQILGRGGRVAEGKTDCLVLDFVGNLDRLGGVECVETYYRENNPEPLPISGLKIKPPKQLPQAMSLSRKKPQAGRAEPLTVRVLKGSYLAIPSKSAPGTFMFLASYKCETEEGYTLTADMFLFPEYGGASRRNAELWFAARGATCPMDTRAAVKVAYALPLPKTIITKRRRDGFVVEREIM